ncbi:MAG: hypothetical protein RL481_893 [Pseudomonadota bacterium]|jgi:hypothetical protein
MHINRQIERFLVINNFPPTKFGRIVAGDPRLVSDIRRGRTLGPRMVERIEIFIAHYSHSKMLTGVAA